MADPFFLLTLTGLAIGIALYLTFRRPERTAYPLRTRRRRAVGVPAALTVGVATAGSAILLDVGLLLEWWRWAVVLSVGVMLYTWLVLSIPRWWRVPVLLLAAGALVPAVDAWRTLPHRVDYLDLSCHAPTLVLREDGDSRSGGPTLALVRIDPPPADGESMAVRVLPGVHLAAEPSQGPAVTEGAGIWRSAVEVGASGRLRIGVTLDRYPPPLWWFPGTEWVSQLSISAADYATDLRAAGPRIEWLNSVSVSEVMEVVRPDRSERFLQPGVYALEYSCGPTDRENV
ncbi:MAG: hypothetical protein WD492_06715 [Alkalispirochaeta sp.]